MEHTPTITRSFDAGLQAPAITVQPDEPLTLNRTNIDFLMNSVRARFEQELHGSVADPQVDDALYFRMIAEAAIQCAEHAARVQYLDVPKLKP